MISDSMQNPFDDDGDDVHIGNVILLPTIHQKEQGNDNYYSELNLDAGDEVAWRSSDFPSAWL